MDQTQITIGKRLLEAYWAAVVIAAIFFFDTTGGYYLTIGGIFIFAVHFIEMFVFNKTIQEHSSNIMRDRLLVLPYGLLVPNQLKLNNNF